MTGEVRGKYGYYDPSGVLRDETTEYYLLHILRDRGRGTTACPACWAMGTNEVKQCAVGEKYFVLVRLEQLRHDKNLLY